MNDNCLTCGGLIMEPNIAYNYAGKVCVCSEAPRIRKRANNARQDECTCVIWSGDENDICGYCLVQLVEGKDE